MDKGLVRYIKAALVALVIFLASGTWLVLTVRSESKAGALGASQLLVKANSDLDEIHVVLTTTQRAAHSSEVTIDNVNKAAIDERFYFENALPPMLASVQGDVEALHGALEASTGLINTASGRVADLKPIQDDAAKLVVDLDTQIKDPLIKKSLVNIEASTSSLAAASVDGAGTVKAVRGMAEDGQHEVHMLVYPKPIITIANWSIRVAGAIGGWFF